MTTLGKSSIQMALSLCPNPTIFQKSLSINDFYGPSADWDFPMGHISFVGKFDGTMFSFHYYIVDTIVLMILGFLGYQYTRTNQMVSQYHWLYERASPLSWKAKG